MEQSKRLKQIVLIDDDALTNMINKKIISMSHPANIVSYTRAQDALEQFRSGTDAPILPDYIFLDINMPDMDGWEFLSDFQRFPSDKINTCKVYMLTSSIDSDDVDKSKTFSSVAGFLSKPLTVANLKMLLA